MNDLFDFLMGHQGGQQPQQGFNMFDNPEFINHVSSQQKSGGDYGFGGMPSEADVIPEAYRSQYQPFKPSGSPVAPVQYKDNYAQEPSLQQQQAGQLARMMPQTQPQPPQHAPVAGGDGSIFSNAAQQMYDTGMQMQGYAGTFGPSYDPAAQAQFSGPRIDMSVDGSMNNAPRGDPWGGIQGSPYAVISDSMGSSDPVHVLGVNGFRTGSSSPFVDYSGPMARQQAVRNNMNISDILGRQDAIRNSHNLDLQKMMMMSSDRQDSIQQRRQADWDRNFMKLPLGRKRGAIDEGERMGTITPEAAQAARLEDTIDAGFMATGMNKDKRPNDLEKFMREVSVRFDPNKMSRAEFINKLIGMGYKADDIKALKDKPGLEQFVPSLLGADAVVNPFDNDRSRAGMIRMYGGTP